MKHLPNVTVCIIDTVNYGEAVTAIHKTLKQITPHEVVFFTDIDVEVLDPGVRVVKIDHLYNTKEYSRWMMKELGKYAFETSHLLVIQSDGYVLDGEQWDDAFLGYDYIGSPWPETDGFAVGNGGFSLRATRLHEILTEDLIIKPLHPEDSAVCRIYRDYLEMNHRILFAPVELANKFAYELIEPRDKTFGFHGKFHPPYVEPIVIKRSGALGDIIQVEPVLEHFYKLGHSVYLDCPVSTFQLFGKHYFEVKHYSQLDKVIKHRVINLDLAYETNPKQLHLKSYFEMAGVKDYKLRNPRLNYPATPMFDNYVVLHIDLRDTNFRNVYGVDWKDIVRHLEDKGYLVIQIGKNTHEKVATYFNSANEVMMAWLIGHCQIFLGIDSGPATIAAACERKCVLFFGSVRPDYIHADLSKMEILQGKCPIGEDGCWHKNPGTRGEECGVEGITPTEGEPPCCVHTTINTIKAINRIIEMKL